MFIELKYGDLTLVIGVRNWKFGICVTDEPLALIRNW